MMGCEAPAARSARGISLQLAAWLTRAVVLRTAARGQHTQRDDLQHNSTRAYARALQGCAWHAGRCMPLHTLKSLWTKRRRAPSCSWSPTGCD